MSSYPKLVIFSNKAIPRMKEIFSGATVDTYHLNKLNLETNDSIISFLKISQEFLNLRHKKATVVSGITLKQLSFFYLSNSLYPTLKITSEHDYHVVPALEEAFSFLKDRDISINHMMSSNTSIINILDYLNVPRLLNIVSRNGIVETKTLEVSEVFYLALEKYFYDYFSVKVPTINNLC
jgi:hypothetical protein